MEPSQLPEKSPDYSLIDPKLIPIAEMNASLSELDGAIEDDGMGVKMSIEAVAVEMPIEFVVMTGVNGELVLGSAPPTQTIETTYMPVFHKVKLGIQILTDEEHGGE